MSYLNDKGADLSRSQNIQFRQFKIWDQYSIGIDSSDYFVNADRGSFKYHYDELKGSVVADSVIIGSSKNENKFNPTGLGLPRDRGHLVKNVKFYNYPNSSAMSVYEAEQLYCR